MMLPTVIGMASSTRLAVISAPVSPEKLESANGTTAAAAAAAHTSRALPSCDVPADSTAVDVESVVMVVSLVMWSDPWWSTG